MLFLTPKSEIKEIMVTCDASTRAYCAMVFHISVNPDGTRRCHLAFVKTRVKPLNQMESKKLSRFMIVARLELLAGLLVATGGVFVQNIFKKRLQIKFFNDSQINFHCLLNHPLTFQPWVSSRIQQIISLTNITDLYYMRRGQNVGSNLPV